MAKNMQPIAKRCKALGLSPAVMGYTEKSAGRAAIPASTAAARRRASMRTAAE